MRILALSDIHGRMQRLRELRETLPDVPDAIVYTGDIVKGVKGAREWDLRMSIARKNLDWEEQMNLALDPDRATKGRSQHDTSGSGCSMCGQYCAMELVAKYLGSRAERC